MSSSAPPPHDADRVLTVPREDDARPGRPTPWREVRAGFLVPTSARDTADAVRPLLDDPELHFTPGLRRGQLVLLPRAQAFVRVALTWEWSVEAASLAVQSWGDELAAADVAVLEGWLRASARTLVTLDRALEDAVARVVDDAADGLSESLPPRPGLDLLPVAPSDAGPAAGRGPAAPSVPVAPSAPAPDAGPAPARLGLVESTLVTRLARPAPGSAHPRVDVVVPDASVPGVETFVDARDGRVLGDRLTSEHEGLATAFTYRVADGAGDVTTTHLRHWHDQHLHARLLAEDARQAYVHLLAGLDAPLSVRYA